MVTLRDYQQEAINSLYAWFEAGKGNSLVVAPTGSGKSVMLAEFTRSAIERFPATRILNVTHVKELIAQNHATLLRMWNDAPAGIYSAGLGRRQMYRQITFAGVQSIARKADRLGYIDLAIVDEAHLIPRKTDTLYGKLFEALRRNNPALKIIGFTATPYRLDSGRLDMGDGAMFDGIAYDIPVSLLVKRGYLAPLISKHPSQAFDTRGLHTRTGDFIEKEMNARFNTDETTKAAVREIIALGADRASWLIFCISVAHAEAVRDALQSSGITCATITGQMPPADRDRLLRQYKQGQIRALTSVGVLATGFDAPRTDLLAFLRPTQSTGLFVQMAGRGMRAHPDKDNCLVLDFAGNVLRHGPVDAIHMPTTRKKKGDGDAPAKVCPECSEIVHAAQRECLCGYMWPESAPDGLSQTATCEPVMNMTAAENWLPVQDITFQRHQKTGSPDSMRVEYLVDHKIVREWICFEHGGYARQKAVQWWHSFTATEPPATVSDALSRLDEVKRPTEAVLIRDGKYHKIRRVRFNSIQEAAA